MLEIIKNPKYQRYALIFIIAIMLIAFLQTCNNNKSLKQDLLVSDNNKFALIDTLKKVKNKANELQYERGAFIAKANELSELNKNLYNEIKKQKNDVIALTIINATLYAKLNFIEDSIRNSKKTSIYNSFNDTYDIPWDFNNHYSDLNYRIIEGYTVAKYDTTSKKILNMGSVMTNFKLKYNITTGFTEEDNKLKIFVKSDNPDMNFDNVQGVLIDPNQSDLIKKLMKPKKWSFGPTFGYGYYIGDNKFGFFIGVSGQYTMFSF